MQQHMAAGAAMGITGAVMVVVCTREACTMGAVGVNESPGPGEATTLVCTTKACLS